jgi:hypothetical protein
MLSLSAQPTPDLFKAQQVVAPTYQTPGYPAPQGFSTRLVVVRVDLMGEIHTAPRCNKGGQSGGLELLVEESRLIMAFENQETRELAL